jgi:hypothetical protein
MNQVASADSRLKFVTDDAYADLCHAKSQLEADLARVTAALAVFEGDSAAYSATSHRDPAGPSFEATAAVLRALHTQSRTRFGSHAAVIARSCGLPPEIVRSVLEDFATAGTVLKNRGRYRVA